MTRILAAALLVVTTAACSPGSDDRPRHLVVITLDTTRADRLGCYGRTDAGTPVLDDLARRGLRFERAYAATPLTLPSHVTIFSGLHPPRTGIHVNEQWELKPGVRLLAERLADEGFYTAAAVGAYPVSAKTPLHRGFQRFDDRLEDPRNPAGLERDAGLVVDAALSQLEHRRERRMFLWVHLFDPHDPYEPTPPFRDRFPDDPYQGEIARVDAALGRLFDGLRTALGDEPLLIAVISDHGEALGDHGEPTHGFFIYESTTRVPWILTGPGVPPGRVETAPVQTADFSPTVLGLLGLDSEGPWDGLALRPDRSPDEPRKIYLESELPRLHFGWSALSGAVDGWRKYVSAPRPELYDLRGDPQETINIIGDLPDEASELEGWLASIRGEDPGEARPVATDPRLISLGYVGAGGAADGSDPKDHLETYRRFFSANQFLEQGFPDRAIPILEGLLAQEDRSGARFRLAQALRMTGRLEEAAAQLDRLEDDHPGADMERARIAIWTEQPELAHRHLERHLLRFPDDAEALMFRGAAREMLGDSAGAEYNYERALSLNPAFGGASLRLAALYVTTGRIEKAREQLAGHMKRHPADPIARGLLDSL